MKLFKSSTKAVVAILLLMTAFTPLYAAKPKTQTKVTYKTISLSSNPAGVQVFCNGQPILVQTPGTVTVPLRGVITPNKRNMEAAYAEARQNSAVTLTFIKEGYYHKTVTLYPSISCRFNEYIFDWPSTVHADMVPMAGSAYDKDKTIVAGEADNRVSRDNAGKTALERTIIRWFFDSDPSGARIFWRVISSVPDEVKNTNETYLMTTPYEETRSFNIQGLTYENSRDVQIEVKVIKNGYEPQVKRFNVRQAIDQQEISGFFMLVKKTE